MDSFFFRVEHDLLKSESFKSLGGSAVKVYLVIGLYADFGTGWAYPSTRTIAKQSGLSRQTVLTALDELLDSGLIATKKSKGRSTAYKIIRQLPPDTPEASQSEPNSKSVVRKPRVAGRDSLDVTPKTGLFFLDAPPEAGPIPLDVPAQFVGEAGRQVGPKRDSGTRDQSHSIPIPGSPFELAPDGRLLVSVDLQELLTGQGLSPKLAEKLATRKDPESVAKVLMNALYLQSQGKLLNGPGYIRAGIEDGYELLPQVANQLEKRRREFAAQMQSLETERERARVASRKQSEDQALEMLVEQLGETELAELVERALELLPAPITRRNPTLSNPFVRAKVYELAGGEPLD